jgi:acetyl esterase/lipase
MKQSLLFLWFLSSLTAAWADEGLPTVQTDLAYRLGNPAWKCDVAHPAIHSKGPLPAVLVIHGGGWREGDKSGERTSILQLARAGYVAISINYRLSGEAPFPACVDDCVSALRWVRFQATQLGIDPRRIGVYGHSSGGHLACMLGLAEPGGRFAPGYLEEFAGPVVSVCASSAPTDFPDWQVDQGEPHAVEFLFGKAPSNLSELMKRASPLTYAQDSGSNTPPFLFLHGSADQIVPPVQSARLVAALQKAGAPVAERIVYDGQPHEYVMQYGSLVWPQILAFFDGTLGAHSGTLRRELETGSAFLKIQGNRAALGAWLAHFDKNGNGIVSREEFPGGDKLYERLGEMGLLKTKR